MSKKHFIAIAADIAEQGTYLREQRDCSRLESIENAEAVAGLETLFDLATRLASTFAGFNSNFDRQRFLTACGF